MRTTVRLAGLATSLALGIVVVASWVGPSNAGPPSPSSNSIIGGYNDPVCPGSAPWLDSTLEGPATGHATPSQAWTAYQPDVAAHLSVPPAAFTEAFNDGASAQMVYVVGTNPVAIVRLTNGEVADGGSGWHVISASICSSLLVNPPETNITPAEGADSSPVPYPSIPSR